jgi:hypothetical protein
MKTRGRPEPVVHDEREVQNVSSGHPGADPGAPSGFDASISVMFFEKSMTPADAQAAAQL